MTREKRLEYLVDLCRGLEDQELDVMFAVASGLNTGRKTYGPIDPVGDTRDWHQEALEEVRDALVYVGAAMIRLRSAGGQ